MEFTFIIPVYKSSKYLISLLKNKILNLDQEVVLTIDCPEDWFLDEVKKLKEKYKNLILDISFERRGKVDALNHAVQLARGKYLIFLDADVYDVKIDLDRLRNLLRKYDIVDFAKVYSRDSWLEKIIFYESLIYNFLALLRNILCYKIYLINGAGFATRKKVFDKVRFRKFIAEDIYFSIEAGINGFKFFSDLETVVYVKQVRGWGQFINQRKRWSMCVPEILFREFTTIFKVLIKEPKVLLDGILYVYPFFILLLYFIFAKYEEKILLLALVIFSKISLVYLILFPFYVYLLLLKLTLAFIIVYIAYSMSLYYISKRLGTCFNLFELALYVLVIYPTVFTFYISAIFLYPFSKHIKIDWKV